MRKKYLLIILTLIVIFFTTSCAKRYQAIKLTEGSQIPDIIKSTLQETVLERGVYYFAETFTDDSSAYLVFCSGDEYADGFDVEITDLTYNYLIKTVSHPTKPIYGFYKVAYLVKEANKNIDYGIMTDTSLIIYRVDGKIGEQAWPVLPLDSELKLIKWWGSGRKLIENDRVTAEIAIQKEQEVHPIYLGRFNRNLEKEYTSGFTDNIYYYYYKVNAVEPFTINIESLAVTRTFNAKYPVDMVVHKQEVDSPYYSDVENYYIMLKITPTKENVYRRHHLFFNDKLEWNLRQ